MNSESARAFPTPIHRAWKWNAQCRCSDRGVNCRDKCLGARVEQNSATHPVHRIAEPDLRLRIGKAERSARARMAKGARVRTHFVARLRKHEAGGETRSNQQHLVASAGFFDAARGYFARIHYPDTVDPAAVRDRAIY